MGTEVHGLHACGGGPLIREGSHITDLLLRLGLHLGVSWQICGMRCVVFEDEDDIYIYM